MIRVWYNDGSDTGEMSKKTEKKEKKLIFFCFPKIARRTKWIDNAAVAQNTNLEKSGQVFSF